MHMYVCSPTHPGFTWLSSSVSMSSSLALMSMMEVRWWGSWSNSICAHVTFSSFSVFSMLSSLVALSTMLRTCTGGWGGGGQTCGVNVMHARTHAQLTHTHTHTHTRTHACTHTHTHTQADWYTKPHLRQLPKLQTENSLVQIRLQKGKVSCTCTCSFKAFQYSYICRPQNPLQL